MLQLVPSVLRAMLEDDGFARATSLRWLFCGGEALPAELARRFRTLLPSAELVNLYGPTEATIDATFWVCDPAPFDPLLELIFQGDPEFSAPEMTVVAYSAFGALKVWHRQRRQMNVSLLESTVFNPPG